MTINRIDRFRGATFQKFCDVLLSADDPEFQAVDGAGGDLGGDGFAVRGDICYQAYGPDVRTLAKIKTKVDESIAKAQGLRSSFPSLRKLIFLTPFDLTIEQHKYLRAAAQGAGLDTEAWGEARLLAMLARRPEVKTEFPEFLLPDLLAEIRKLGVQAASLPKERAMNEDDLLDAMEGLGGELPWIDVLQPTPEHPNTSCAAYEYFKLYVVSPALHLPSIEPEDEDQLLAAVRDRFWEDRFVEIETRDHRRVLVQHGLPALTFHRRWGRWTAGCVTMASTIRDLNRAGTYSVADIACDVTRALRLAAHLGGAGPARVVFGYDPCKLEATFDLSDGRTRDDAQARLDGVQAVERPVLRETRESTWAGEFDLAQLASDAHTIAASLIVPAVKFFHLARIDSKQFAASIPRLVSLSLDAYRQPPAI